MCLISKKPLFVSGAAFQAVVLLSASNIEQSFKIINGKGRGSEIDLDIKLDKKLKRVRANEFILDRITGDLFSYNHENREWLSQGNSGMHHR